MEFDKLLMDRICKKLDKVKQDGRLGICRENGKKYYDCLIYSLIGVIAKEVGDDCDDFLGSLRENGGWIGRIFLG